MILRLLFPSWRLFDRLGTVPKLYVRVLPESDTDGPWLTVLTRPRRRWWNFFVNPEGNLHHAICNGLDRFLQNPEDQKSLHFTMTLATRFLKIQRGCGAGTRFQFKLTALQILEGRPTEQDVFVSQEVTL